MNVSKLDKLDQAIIRELQDDGSLSFRQLSARCRSSEATVRRRVTRLRKTDVIRLVAVADPFKLGYPVIAIFTMKIDQRLMRDVKNTLASMKELRFVGVTIGGYDVVAEAWFQSTDEMLNFTTERLAHVQGILRIEPLQILEMVTYAYDWGKRK
jgi:Lrp/AsnC family transcriptional regulator, regulator for asnA, asnC and gidA